MSTPDLPWTVLGIEPTEDSGAIRRAYAARLKVTRPEDDRAGFERLRAAYEHALQWARNATKVVVDPPVSQPQSTTTAAPPPLVEQPATIDADQENLRRAFTELQAMLSAKRSHSAEATRAVDTILTSPALENISLEPRIQHQLAVLLAAAIPASDPFLERAIARFRWDRVENELDLSPPLVAILNRRRDLQFLEAMKSGQSPYSPAFQALQRPKRPIISRLMPHLSKAGVPTEHQLIQLLRTHHPSLLSALEPSAVAWWDEFLSRPRVSVPIILAGLLLAALGGVVIAEDEGTTAGLLSAGGTMLVSAILVLWKLYLLDWPRHWLRVRFPVPPMPVLAGWLPASIGILLLAMLPVWNFLAWIVALLALGAVQWSWIVGWSGDGDTKNLMRVSLVRMLFLNFLALLWWVGAVVELTPATPQLQTAVYGALAASALGLPATLHAWQEQLSARGRWLWLFATAGMTLIAAACLFWLTDREAWRPVAAALVVVTLVMHRHFTVILGKRQQEIRLGWAVAYFIGLVVVTAGPDEPSRLDFALKGFGSLLVSTVLMCTLMGMWNEWRLGKQRFG